jgi:hypothetical protein
MKNQTMWFSAIIVNILTCITYWMLNPKVNRGFDYRALFLFFFLIGFNFIIGFTIAAYTAFKGRDIEGHPFLMISLLLLLISWGVCHL